MQLVLQYEPQQVGFAFVPGNAIMALISVFFSAMIVMRWGLRIPAAVGLFIAAIGMFWFARAPVDGSFLIDILPSMILLGIGAGMAFNPVLLAAMGEVPPDESGLASGVVNTAFMMGGSLGLAVLAAIAASRTESLIAAGTDQIAALNSGYQLAFLAGAIFAVIAALGSFLLREVIPPGEGAAAH
jgi:MFS family permease